MATIVKPPPLTPLRDETARAQALSGERPDRLFRERSGGEVGTGFFSSLVGPPEAGAA